MSANLSGPALIGPWCAGIRQIQGTSLEEGWGVSMEMRKLCPSPLSTYTGPAAEIRELVQQAQQKVAEKNFASATLLYQKAEAISPTDAMVQAWLADTLYWSGKYKEAFERYRHAIKLDPYCTTAWRYLAQAQCQMGDPIAACNSLGWALEADPMDPGVWASLQSFVGDGREDVRWRPWPWPYVYEGKLNLPENRHQIDNLMSAIYVVRHHVALEKSPGVQTLEGSLQRHRAAVEEAFGAAQQVGGTPGHFWTILRLAHTRGQLDAAIFLLGMEVDLFPFWQQWRGQHPGQVAAFVRTTLLPQLLGARLEAYQERTTRQA